MDKKQSAIAQIQSIIDDGADKDENSEDSAKSMEAVEETGEDADAADKNDDGGSFRMARGGSVSVNDDTIFGEAGLGRARSKSIEANRPRPRQEHTNVFGSILENIHENINFEDDAHPEEDTGLESAPS